MSLAFLSWTVVAIGAGVLLVTVFLLYLLRRTPRSQLVSNVDFWLRAMERSKPRTLQATRIPFWSLLFSLLIALLLLLVAAGPRFGDGVRGTTVIVVSADQTMGAEEDGLRRADRAIEQAKAWVGRATSSGQVAVIRAGIRPSVLLPLTGDDADAEPALRDFSTDDGPADLDAATALAEQVIAHSGGTGQILIFADRAPGLRTEVPSVLIPVGATADTVAVTALATRRTPTAVGEYTVHVEVTSYAGSSATARLLVRDREVVIFDQPLNLEPGQRLRFAAQGFSSAQGEVTAELQDIEIAGSTDALTSDDRHFAVAPALGRTRVLLVSPGNQYLEQVLAAHSALDVDLVDAGGLRSLSTDALLEHDVLILDRVVPDEPLPHPGVFVIAAPGAQGIGAGEALNGPEVSATLASHPALGGVRLDTVQVLRARAVETAATDRVLCRSGRHSLITAREERGRRTVVSGFAFQESDLPGRIAFPLMMHHSIQWLRGTDSALPFAAHPGSPLRAANDQTVLDPEEEALVPRGGAIDDTREAGIYHVGERAFAFAPPRGPIPAPAPSIAPRGTDALPPLFVLLAAGLLFLMAAEWFLLHRGKLA
ncbi:MAG: VWA domain-containing protein [Myxococcota bacterium]